MDVPLIKSVYDLCKKCAHIIWALKPPSISYADRIAKLLFMTASHESYFIYRRQKGFSKTSDRGAFSLFQLEWNTIQDHLKWLSRKLLLTKAAEAFLINYTLPTSLLDPSNKQQILLILQEEQGDPLGCLYARLHYLRIPEPIPGTIEEMGNYAKKYYNTYKGKARAEDYIRAFNKFYPIVQSR